MNRNEIIQYCIFCKDIRIKFKDIENFEKMKKKIQDGIDVKETVFISTNV